MAIRPLVAGNWKMNGLGAQAGELEALMAGLAGMEASCDVMLCPPATLIARFAKAAKAGAVAIGGQDCHWQVSGAHTGDISAEMLADAGARAVIVGHSERRTDHGEGDHMVRRKAQAAHRAGLTAIICIGETEAERTRGATLDVISTQIKGSVPKTANAQTTVIAYEPVWAIGTGLTPSIGDVAEAHSHIREQLRACIGKGSAEHMRILYGGSVKPANAGELMAVAHVNGALVGGASLKAKDFLAIIAACR